MVATAESSGARSWENRRRMWRELVPLEMLLAPTGEAVEGGRAAGGDAPAPGRPSLSYIIQRTSASRGVTGIPRSSYHVAWMGHTEPSLYKFQGRTVSISIPANSAQLAVEDYKNHSERATRDFQRLLDEMAKRDKKAERARLKKETDEAEEKAQLLKTLKI